MLNLKAPRATTLAACAALALGGMAASADAATTNGFANGGLRDCRGRQLAKSPPAGSPPPRATRCSGPPTPTPAAIPRC